MKPDRTRKTPRRQWTLDEIEALKRAKKRNVPIHKITRLIPTRTASAIKTKLIAMQEERRKRANPQHDVSFDRDRIDRQRIRQASDQLRDACLAYIQRHHANQGC